MELLRTSVYENPVWVWFLSIGIVLVVAVFLRFGIRLFLRRLLFLVKHTKTEFDDLLVQLLDKTKIYFVVLISLYAGSLALSLPSTANHVISILAVLVMLFQIGFWGSTFVSFWSSRYMRQRLAEDAERATSMSGVAFMAKLILWTVLLLIGLQNLGVNVTTLVAGLGVGGIAVAFALQKVLGDMFSSLAIMLDKPFVISDFIIVGDMLGTIEKIGLKTTRVRSLSGEQLIFSNSDLLESRIRNYKRMRERRIAFSFGVTYGTPYDKLAAIPSMVREIIEAQEQARFDRAHFKEYGDFSLNFEAVYYVLVPDYNAYMDIQQAINLALYHRFEEAGIEFAFPTQTLYLKGADKTDGYPSETG